MKTSLLLVQMLNFGPGSLMMWWKTTSSWNKPNLKTGSELSSARPGSTDRGTPQSAEVGEECTEGRGGNVPQGCWGRGWGGSGGNAEGGNRGVFCETGSCWDRGPLSGYSTGYRERMRRGRRAEFWEGRTRWRRFCPDVPRCEHAFYSSHN